MHVFNVKLEQTEPAWELLVAQSTSEHSIDSLFEYIYSVHRTKRLRAQALVIRPDVKESFTAQDLASSLAGGSANSEFLSKLKYAGENNGFVRFADYPVFILYWDGEKTALSGNVNPLTSAALPLKSGQSVTDVIDIVRDAEMRHLMSTSHAVLPPVENTFYENPSHQPAKSFLRVGNIQYSRLAIDAVTFWLLPSLKGCQAILVDTWSLSSIAFNCSRVLASMRNQGPVPVEMLSQYQNRGKEGGAALAEVLGRLRSDASQVLDSQPLKISIIISVTHTGSLAKFLREQSDFQVLPVELDFTAIYRLGGTEAFPSLCDLSNDADFTLLTHEAVQGRTPIPIDARTYFPSLYVDFPHKIRKGQADPFREFGNMVQGHDVLSVHRDQVDDSPPRHHGIHIDTEKLADIAAFKRRFKTAVLALEPPPSVILIPKHEAARKLAKQAAAALKAAGRLAPPIVEHTSLSFNFAGAMGAIDQAVKAALDLVQPESAILTLDDCFITGARMTGYQTRLRANEIQGRLHYLVAVARPEDLAVWKEFQSLLKFRAPEDRDHHSENTVGAVFEIALPNWQNDTCPWCVERLNYQGLQYKGASLPQIFTTRGAMLADVHQGLHDELFLDPNTGDIKLYSGSIFARKNSSQAEVFCAVAAAIQQLRNRPPNGLPALGRRRHPIATILRYVDYLHTTFTDTIIRASIFRASDRDELVYSAVGTEAKRSQAIGKLIALRETDQTNLMLEIALAHTLGKCTIPAASVEQLESEDAANLVRAATAASSVQ